MASDLLLHLLDQLNQPDGVGRCSEENICIDQDEELDNLFDELDNILDADDLLHSLDSFNHDGDTEELDFDIDFRFGNCNPLYMKSSSCSTDAGMAIDSRASCAGPSPISAPGPVGSLSPHSLHGESQVPQSQMFPVSSSCSGVMPEEMQQKHTKRATRVRSAEPSKPPVPLAPKVALPLETVISNIPEPQPTTPLQSKTFVIHTLQAVPVTTLPPEAVRPACLTGHAVTLSQPAQVVQMCPQVMSAPPTDHMPVRVVTALATICDPVALPGGRAFQAETPPLMTSSLRNPGTREDASHVTATRQQRLIRNRESASLSRKKKKEYLMGLEARLQVALFENEKLKTENGTLRKQLEGLLNENTNLRSSAPKHRNLCVFVVLLFLALSVGPVSLRQGEHISKLSGSASPTHNGRHLLGFSTPETSDTPSDSSVYSMSDEKAAIMKKRLSTLPCQPAVNRTKSLQISHELRGWVSRHEEERIRWMERKIDGRQFSMKSEKTSDKTSGAAILSIRSPDLSEKNSSKELQVYYGSYESYSDMFEEIHRRDEAFYVISFHREHLLLPAVHHNKGTRPKMSVVLPAMNDSVIKDNGHEVMMQIDCEVTDTRILHMKTSSIPLFLRVNQTGSSYRTGPANGQAAPGVGVLKASTSPTL